MSQTPEQKRNWNRHCLDFINDVYGGWPQCTGCRRYHDDGTCDAFPDGIPHEIVTGLWDHRKPFPGDRGLRFVQSPDVDPELKIGNC